MRGAKSRAAEYLLAAHALRGQPNADDFMLIADGGDLNPTMTRRWRAYLERARRSHHPVWAPWHALADLPEKDFAGRALEWASAGPDRPVNPRVARAFREKPPASLAEMARLYAVSQPTVSRILAAWRMPPPDDAATARKRG